jgi:uncharacterized protein (TIGR02646 family)
MIPVTPQPPPPDFDFANQVALPGDNALLELIGDPSAAPRRGKPRRVIAQSIASIPAKDLPNFWRRALPALSGAYGHTCAYLGLRIHPATGAAEVDHFQPKSRYQHLAYRWENFRLSCKRANTNKGDHEDVLDPFTIAQDLFTLNLFSGEVEIGPAATSPAIQEKVKATIKRLKLNDEPTFLAARKDYIDRHFAINGPASLPVLPPMDFLTLQHEAPFVAAEINRQGKKRI